MKKMTCAQMGGPCNDEISGNTPEEMAANGMKHVQEKHPEMADKMKSMTKEENDKWMADFMVKWNATPDSM